MPNRELAGAPKIRVILLCNSLCIWVFGRALQAVRGANSARGKEFEIPRRSGPFPRAGEGQDGGQTLDSSLNPHPRLTRIFYRTSPSRQEDVSSTDLPEEPKKLTVDRCEAEGD